MYVTSASANLPELPMFKEQGAGYVGVTVCDRFVTFAKDAELIDDSPTISVRNNGFGEVSVLLTDMSEGVWTVTGDGKTVNVESKTGENCVYFKGAPGTYKLVKAAEETVADIITSAETPKRAIGDFFIWKASETTTSNGYGSFVYLKHPTILNEGTSYVSVETLGEIGAHVSVGDESITVYADGGTLVYNKINKTWTIDGEAYAMSVTPFEMNGTVYVAVRDVKSLLGISLTYDHYAKTLIVKKSGEQN